MTAPLPLPALDAGSPGGPAPSVSCWEAAGHHRSAGNRLRDHRSLGQRAGLPSLPPAEPGLGAPVGCLVNAHVPLLVREQAATGLDHSSREWGCKGAPSVNPHEEPQQDQRFAFQERIDLLSALVPRWCVPCRCSCMCRTDSPGFSARRWDPGDRRTLGSGL